MTVLADQNKTRLLNTSSYIDKVIDNIKQEKFQIDLSIEHLERIPRTELTKANKQNLSSLGDKQAEICQQLVALNNERSRAGSLESRRLKCERIMREAEKEIERSSNAVFASKMESMHLHSYSGGRLNHSVSLVSNGFNKLHDSVMKFMAGEIAPVSALNKEFDSKMIKALREDFNCRNPQKCWQLYVDIKGAKRAMMKSLVEHSKAYHERKEIISEEHAAYARISQEYKIEP